MQCIFEYVTSLIVEQGIYINIDNQTIDNFRKTIYNVIFAFTRSKKI